MEGSSIGRGERGLSRNVLFLRGCCNEGDASFEIGGDSKADGTSEGASRGERFGIDPAFCTGLTRLPTVKEPELDRGKPLCVSSNCTSETVRATRNALATS